MVNNLFTESSVNISLIIYTIDSHVIFYVNIKNIKVRELLLLTTLFILLYTDNN